MATKKGKAAAKKPAAKRAPRPKAPTAAKVELPPAASTQPAPEAKAAGGGSKVKYRKPSGSLHEGTIKTVGDDGIAHIFVGDGSEAKAAPRAAGAEPGPGEWTPI